MALTIVIFVVIFIMAIGQDSLDVSARSKENDKRDMEKQKIIDECQDEEEKELLDLLL